MNLSAIFFHLNVKSLQVLLRLRRVMGEGLVGARTAVPRTVTYNNCIFYCFKFCVFEQMLRVSYVAICILFILLFLWLSFILL